MKLAIIKKKAKAPGEEKGECAPLWIISFADMISLLMAFFVMLLAMANTQSGKLCNPGEGIFERTVFGFKSSISGFGLPGLFGGANEPDSFEYGKSHYNLVGDSNEPSQRVIDAREEKVRRLYNQMQDTIKTSARQKRIGNPTFVATPIVFQEGQAVLDDSAKQFLTQFVLNLSETEKTPAGIYVVGLAGEGLPEQQTWLLSVRRAEAAGDFIEGTLPAGKAIPVYCWGAGKDSRWTSQEENGLKQPQILITVLQATD